MTVSGSGEMGNLKFPPYSSHSSSVTSIVIEEGITSVGSGAFSNFSKLKSVKLPETLEHIDADAFSYCYNLYSINIPDSVQYIGNAAFYGTYFISKITDDYIVLGDGVLYDYQGKNADIIIPDGVKSITDKIFTSDSSITSVYIPGSVKRIGENAFLDCANLKYAVIPYGTSHIGNYAFGYTLSPAPQVNPDFTLYALPDSYGSYYAIDNGINYGITGDLNNNNQLDSYDALLILQNIVGTNIFNAQQKAVADVNSDNMITSYDALEVLNYVINQ